MFDFKKIRKICEAQSAVSRTVIDEFLLYLAAALYGLDRSMTEVFSDYKQVTQGFEKEWVNRLKAQYIAHQIFKEGGLIRKLLKHSELSKLSQSEMEFLVNHSGQPWRFCFSTILTNPAPDFFFMEDILTGKIFTLFSPATSDILKERPISLWFNLIGFNGACWQTYGPIAGYQSFEPDDIFFFATELDRKIVSDEDIIKSIDKNPVPYMMLLSGAAIPITVHNKDELVINYAEYPLDQLDTLALKKSFTSEYSDGVYRLTLKRWGGHPHFAQIYFDENGKNILFTASTDRGFVKLVNALRSFGYQFSEESGIRVKMSMLITAEKILRKKIRLNEYDELFHIESTPEEKETLDNLNLFMSLIVPDINAGRTPDIEKNAAKAGIDVETAWGVYNAVSAKFGEMGRRKR